MCVCGADGSLKWNKIDTVGIDPESSRVREWRDLMRRIGVLSARRFHQRRLWDTETNQAAWTLSARNQQHF